LQQSSLSIFEEVSFVEECLDELFSHAKELLGINKKPNNTITKM
jgi:hypothetical protein